MSIEAAFLDLIRKLNPYSEKMEFGHLRAPSTPGVVAEAHPPSTNAAPTAGAAAAGGAAAGDGHQPTRANIQVEIDNYKGEWSFRGGTEQIKRSLRITYRYPVLERDADGKLVRDEKGHTKETGFYATEHLLIGYAGGNH